MNNSISVAGTVVWINKNGMYCLNDLHKASGGESKNRPNYWAKNAKTVKFLHELSKTGIPALEVSKGGDSSGTYACKEAVYNYAMWVSPKFLVEVIRTYDRTVNSTKILDPLNLSRSQILLIAYEAENERLLLENKVNEMVPKVGVFDRVCASYGSVNLTDAAKSLKIPIKELTAFLSKNKWIYKRGSNWVGYQTKTNSGHLEHNINFVNKDRFSSHSDVFFVQVMITAKGIVKVAEMLESQFA